jgi:hypothetical protein
MFGYLYKGYIAVLSIGHDKPNLTQAINKSVANGTFPKTSELVPLIEIDSIATRLGNHYRGIGVAVGLLGAAIVFFAVTPNALELHDLAGKIIGGIEIALMLIMLGFIIYGTKSNLRQKWIKKRSEAELLRYQGLRSCIENLRNAMSTSSSKVTHTESIAILKGPNGQATYNLKKHFMYERIEKLSDRAAWFGFLLGLVGASLHLSPIHAAWFIYLTAFIPALVGAIHGVNSFLQIGILSEDHGVMAERLSELLHRFEQTNSNDVSATLKLSEALYGLLSNREGQWIESTEKLGLKPA